VSIRYLLAEAATKMRDEEWIKTLADSRRVKFTYQELPDDGAFITAQIERLQQTSAIRDVAEEKI
jgi:hypothetical protein